LPAPIVNGGGDRLGKVQLLELQKLHELDLDLGSGYTAYHHASVIDLYLHTKFHRNRKNFFVDELTAGTPPSSRSRDTKTKKNVKNPA